MSSTIIISAVDTDNDDFTSSTLHRLSTGDAVKLSATVAPTGTINNTTYYARVINSTKFAIHATKNNAINNINQIAVSSQGTNVTFLVVGPQFVDTKISLSVGHLGVEPVPATFSDYSRELVFVEGVDTDYSEIIFLASKTDQVFMQGLTTSPTYIYTDDAPKAAPTPAQIKEYWYLT